MTWSVPKRRIVNDNYHIDIAPLLIHLCYIYLQQKHMKYDLKQSDKTNGKVTITTVNNTICCNILFNFVAVIYIYIYIYIIISQNIRYLLWNRGFCRSLNNTYPIFLTPCIRCTNHLCDSCDLTDVNPHFIPSLLRKIQNVDLLWRHRYSSRPPAIVTSQWPIVPAWLLWVLS